MSRSSYQAFVFGSLRLLVSAKVNPASLFVFLGWALVGFSRCGADSSPWPSEQKQRDIAVQERTDVLDVTIASAWYQSFVKTAPLSCCSLLTTSDEQTEDGHAMMKAEELSHAVRGCYNSVLSLSEIEKEKHTGQLSTNVRQHHRLRAHVTKDRPGSGTLTVKVPW